MNPEEYDNLDRVEKLHWYYAGKRQIVRYWIAKTSGIQPEMKLLDCGAGSGAFAVYIASEINVAAMDDHEESLDILRIRLPEDRILNGSCTSIPLPDLSVDIVTALDVLEHIPDHQLAVAEMIRVLKPGGRIIVTVPSMMCLWSDWDVSLHHQRRYSRQSLLAAFAGQPCHIEHCAYINSLAFPLVWLARKARAVGIGKKMRAEDRIPNSIINRLLQMAFVQPACSGWLFPFGVGLLLVGKKL